MQIETLHAMTSARLALIPIGSTLRAAALALSRPQVGLAIVCDGKKAAGVISKSDIIRHLTNVGVADAAVATLMNRSMVFCRPDDELHATWQMMAAQSLQNMPVLDVDLVPLGILDIRDALQVLFKNEEYQEQLLLNYVGGVGYQ
jgi:predicted transcriptional regulator